MRTKQGLTADLAARGRIAWTRDAELEQTLISGLISDREATDITEWMNEAYIILSDAVPLQDCDALGQESKPHGGVAPKIC
jgi:hypothetical protein